MSRESPVLVSIAQFALETGHARATVAQLIARARLTPSGTRRGYPVFALRALLQLRQVYATRATDPAQMKPFERLAHHRAETELLRVNTARSQLMEAGAADREVARVRRVLERGIARIVPEIRRDVTDDPRILAKLAAKVTVIRELLAHEWGA